MTAEPLTVSERGNRLSGLSIRRENQAYAALFLIPTAALFIGLIGYPVLYSLLLTVTGRSTVPGRLGPFVGLDNWLPDHDRPDLHPSCGSDADVRHPVGGPRRGHRPGGGPGPQRAIPWS